MTSWTAGWHAQNWWRSLERYAFPRIGRWPVSEVDTADVLEILTPISHVKAETVRASASAQPDVKLAFESLVLTAARSAEVRRETGVEIDTTGRL